MRTPYLKYIVFLFEFVMDVIKFVFLTSSTGLFCQGKSLYTLLQF